MKLQVNLIRGDERRSASPVSLKTVGVALGLLLLGGLLITVGLKFYRIAELTHHLEQVQRLTSDLNRRETAEKQRDTLLERIQAYESELAFWLDSAFDWAPLLHDLARETPAQIQIERLRLQQSTLDRDGRLRRIPQVSLQCRVESVTPEPLIREFHAMLVRKSGDPESFPEDFRPLPGADDASPAHGFRMTLRFAPPEETP